MITLITHNTPNGHKISIALEELGLPYEARTVDVRTGAQFAPDFVRLNPNAKIPVIVDDETGQVVYESNAILLYLADKAGRLVPKDGPARWEALQLLFFQAASVGPMFGQRAHFSLFAPPGLDYAAQRYVKEGERLNDVMETLLADRPWFLASGYSIVDIAHFGWLHTAVRMGFAIGARPKLADWFERMLARPAVRTGITIPAPLPDFDARRRAAAG